MNLTKNFSTDELKCPCCDRCEMLPPFMAKLQIFRDRWGKPLSINSGFRCKKHNEEVGGAMRSQHLKGVAVDINLNPSHMHAFIKLAFEVGFTGIGIGVTYVHLDLRNGPPALWRYDATE